VNNSQFALSINQRNIYLHYLAHKKKYGNVPCSVPKSPLQGSRLADHLKAMAKLEERGFIRIERPSEDYLSWTIISPES
jgi:hypothetical protein